MKNIGFLQIMLTSSNGVTRSQWVKFPSALSTKTKPEYLVQLRPIESKQKYYKAQQETMFSQPSRKTMRFGIKRPRGLLAILEKKDGSLPAKSAYITIDVLLITTKTMQSNRTVKKLTMNLWKSLMNWWNGDDRLATNEI